MTDSLGVAKLGELLLARVHDESSMVPATSWALLIIIIIW